MESRQDTRQIPRQVRRASIEPKSIDLEARTADVVWSTGAQVRRFSWSRGDYVEELDLKGCNLARLNAGAPVLDAHDNSSTRSVIGVVVDGSAKIAGGEGRATLRFAKDEDSERIWSKVADGILRQISVGYEVHEYEQIERKGEDPLLIARNWTPVEISPVPIGADPGAGVRANEITVTCVVTSRAKESEMPDTTQTTTAAVVDEAKIRAEAATNERKRIAEIREAGDRFGVDEVTVRSFIDEGLDTTAAKLRILDLRAKKETPPATPRTELTRAAEDKTVESMGLALMHRAVAQADPGRVHKFNEGLRAHGKANEVLAPMVDESTRRFARARLVDVAEDFLRSRGISTGGMSHGVIAETALAYRGNGGMMTTADFPGLLANTANKMLAIGYTEVTSPWREIGIARRVDRPDFKTFTMYRKAGAPGLAKINEHGEIKRSGWADGTGLTGQLSTAGVEVAFTRQMLINDDMEAFSQQNLGLGESAIRWEDDAVITDLLYGNAVLSDTVAFFDSTRGNLATDVGTPDMAAILAFARMFGAMTETVNDPANNNGTKTRKLFFALRGFLSGMSEKFTLDSLIEPRFPAAASDKLPASLGTLQTFRDDRLQVETSAPDVFFALSNRTALVYGGLLGDPSPRLSMMHVTSGVDGFIWQLIHDWYVAVEDPKAIIRIPKS